MNQAFGFRLIFADTTPSRILSTHEQFQFNDTRGDRDNILKLEFRFLRLDNTWIDGSNAETYGLWKYSNGDYVKYSKIPVKASEAENRRLRIGADGTWTTPYPTEDRHFGCEQKPGEYFRFMFSAAVSQPTYSSLGYRGSTTD